MNVRKDILVIFLIGFGLYANTLRNEYALDDKIVITENQFTKQGFAGIPALMTTDVFVGFYGRDKNLVTGKRYRPLSLVTFAIEYALFGENPFISHLINVLLYAFTGVLLYLLLLKVLPDKNNNTTFWTTAFVTACLYIAHPLHTEVVANIKGRDEILTLLGALWALYFTLKFLDEKNRRYLAWASICLLLGLFAKENAITFIFVIPVTVYFFTGHSLKDNLRALLPLLAVTGLYLITRFYLLGIPETKEATELMNNPFVGASPGEKYATIFYTFGKYMTLLVWPHPLTHDYYPFQIPIISWGDIRAVVPFLITVALAVMGLYGLRNRKPTFYASLFSLATFSIVSNIVFPIGSFMNERFMYIPSIGFAMVLGIAATHGLYKHLRPENKMRPLIRALTVFVLIGYAYKTISRNAVWKNDLTLSTTDVKVSANSAKANMSAGLSLLGKAQEETGESIRKPDLIQAIAYLNKSLSLYPTYIQPMLLMGNAYYELGQYETSLQYFENCLKITPGYSYAVNNIEHVGDLTTRKGDYKTALKSYLLLTKYTPRNYRTYVKLGELYGRYLSDFESALSNLQVADQLKPDDKEVLNKLGIVYSQLNRPLEAIAALRKVLEQEPDNANTLLNIGITYLNMGQPEIGQPYIDKAVALDPKLKRQ